MTLKQQFEKVMGETVNMALATSIGDQPNVRTVTFAYDESKSGKLFFATFKENQKTKEFQQNPKVACTPLSMDLEAEVQVRIFGTVKKSDLTMDKLVEMISKKFPSGADTLETGGEMLDIYEVCFKDAHVTVCMADAQLLTFA